MAEVRKTQEQFSRRPDRVMCRYWRARRSNEPAATRHGGGILHGITHAPPATAHRRG